MIFKSKKIPLIILGAVSIICSRVIFSFINDPEGPNLLIVVVLAAIIFIILFVFLLIIKKIQEIIFKKSDINRSFVPSEIKNWIGKKVKVIMDRPLGSKHPDPRFSTIYTVNYGYIPDTLSEADNEEIDAYVLGPTEPLKEFEGIIIAGIKRISDGEVKFIVTDGTDYSNKEIEELTYFQEKYHQSKLYR